MMTSEKLTKCLKRLTKARNVARKCRKWLASSRCMDDMPAVKEASFQAREDMLGGEQRLDCAIRELEALISIVGIKEGLEEKVYQFGPKSKVEEVAVLIEEQYSICERHYLPVVFPITERLVYQKGDVRIWESRDYEYIVILGLTQEEQEELERKLKENNK